MPVKAFLVGDLTQGFSRQRAIQHGGHAGRCQLKERKNGQGRNAALLQLRHVVDEPFGVRAKQRGRKQPFATKQFKDVPVGQQVDFRAVAVLLQDSGAFNHRG